MKATKPGFVGEKGFKMLGWRTFHGRVSFSMVAKRRLRGKELAGTPSRSRSASVADD